MYDWQRLGLDGPTADLAAIRRAYALKLKVTRPDDDAAAYQALREAYDRIQHYARWRREHAAQGAGAEGAEAEPVEAKAAQAEAPSPPAAEESPQPHPAPTPEDLCSRLLEARSSSRQALDQFLPILRSELHELPLTYQAEASVRFADLVLHTHPLPAELLKLLQDHFGWLDDFRNVHLLGQQRAAALQDALGGLERQVTDPTTLRMHAETLAIHSLSGKGRNLKALLITSLMGIHLQRQIESAGPSLLRRLGVGIDSQRRLMRLMSQGQWVRTGGVALLVFLFGWVLTRSLEGAVWGTGFALGLGMGGPIFLLWALGILYLGRRRTVIPQKWALRLQLWRWSGVWPWMGLALLASLAALQGLVLQADGAAWFIGLIVLAFIGLQLAMPETMDQGFVAVSLWLYVAAVLQLHHRPEWLLPAAVWVLAGMQVHLRRVYVADDAFAEGWAGGARSILAPLVLLSIGLPTMLSWMAERAGFRLVIAALVLAFTPMLMRHGLSPVAAIFVAPAVALTTLASIQKCSLRLARRLVQPAA